MSCVTEGVPPHLRPCPRLCPHLCACACAPALVRLRLCCVAAWLCSVAVRLGGQVEGIHALATPDDCFEAEAIAKADPQVQALLKER